MSSSSCSAPGGRAAPWSEQRGRRAPVLLNVEHLSAEAVRRAPRTACGRRRGVPANRRRRHGSTSRVHPPSGGLLRERGLLERRREFGTGDAWLASLGIAPRTGERRVSVFCYRNDAVRALLDALAPTPTLLLATPGPAAEQVAACLGPSLARGALRAVALPLLGQADFDRLLWSCDLNLVRGEDSFVRAIWAGAPFVWQPYVQDDGAHRAKLDAFLDRYLAARRLADGLLRSAFARWNGDRSRFASRRCRERDPLVRLVRACAGVA